MKRCIVAVSVLVISCFVSACSGKDASSAHFTVGGMVSGLTGTLVLQNNDGDDLTVTADGSFTFGTARTPGSSYTVTVLAEPAGQTCLVSNSEGTLFLSDVTDVSVHCSALFTVGGVVTGLTGTLVLQNNDGDDLAVVTNGSFTFLTALASESSYTVTVLTEPIGQTCLISNSTGTIFASNVTDISVDCYKSGALDPSFGSPDGFIVHNNAAGGNAGDVGKAVAVDSQGRIVSAGSSTNSAGNTDMVIWRFNADGTPDTSFNGSGIMVYDNVAGGSGDDSGNAIAIDSQNRILVTGSTTSAGNVDMAIWRFKADGTPDTFFNNSGIVVYDNVAGGSGDDSGNAIAIDSQGMILVTGSTTSAGNKDMAVWRFNANGIVDTGFNKSGITPGLVVHNNAAGGNGDDFGKAIAIDSSGRILIAGSSTRSAGNTDMAIWKFKADGTLDTTFNTTGFVVQNNAAGGIGDDFGNAIAVDSQGKILVTGSSKNGAVNMDMVIWRFATNGTLDTAFNGSGIVINNGAAGGNGDDSGNGIAIDSQGRILVTGRSQNGSGNTDMVVWRFKTDGALDNTFADVGFAAHNGAAWAGGTGDDSGNDIAIDSQGRILIAGSSGNSAGNADMVLWRVFP